MHRDSAVEIRLVSVNGLEIIVVVVVYPRALILILDVGGTQLQLQLQPPLLFPVKYLRLGRKRVEIDRVSVREQVGVVFK